MNDYPNLLSPVIVKEMPEIRVACIIHKGSYSDTGKYFSEYLPILFEWAGKNGYLNYDTTKVLTVFRDDPAVTDESELRTCYGISVPDKAITEGRIEELVIPQGTYACGSFNLKEDEFSGALDYLYKVWFPSGNYVPDISMRYNIYPKQPVDGRMKVEIYIPVKVK